MMRGDGADQARNEAGMGLYYLANNQGKKAICLDLNQDEGRDVARQLIASADVLVQNYANGLERHELGPEQALKINQQLIYCSMSGFGSNNPFSGRSAYDPVIQAFSGMMSVNGEAEQARLRVGPPLVDYGTGAQAAFAIASALYQRSQTGKGQIIDVNMLDAALVMMTPMVLNSIHRGETDARTGNVQTSRPGYAVFDCSDDPIMLGAYNVRQHRSLFQLLGFDDLDSELENHSYSWLETNGAELRRRMQQCLITQTADYWETQLNQNHIPAARVRDLHGMLCQEQSQRSPESQARGLSESQLTAPAAAFKFASDGPVFHDYCAGHGEDTENVLSELGITVDRIDELKELGVI